ncbi:MAG: PilZ domain-containing protein [Bryobacterales bacterium]
MVKLSFRSAATSLFGLAIEKLAAALRRTPERQERRENLRVPAHGSAKLFRTGPLHGGHEMVVNVVDMSARGLAVRCEWAIPVGERVLLGDGRMLVSGIVRRCTPDEAEMILGIELEQKVDGAAAQAMKPSAGRESLSLGPGPKAD